jgi:hypothetical protein
MLLLLRVIIVSFQFETRVLKGVSLSEMLLILCQDRKVTVFLRKAQDFIPRVLRPAGDSAISNGTDMVAIQGNPRSFLSAFAPSSQPICAQMDRKYKCATCSVSR